MYVAAAEAAKTYAKSLRLKMRELSHDEVRLAPPFPLLSSVAQALAKSSIAVGAQALSQFPTGAHTGEVSAPMLKSAGATFSIIGHSERRAMGETNDAVRAQVLEASSLGLGIVLCVGERERHEGGEHFTFIKDQLTSALSGLAKKSVSKLVIAYEPVWAIGKHAGDAMPSHEIHETVIFIRKTLTGILEPDAAKKVPILYGGSVEESNAPEILKDGGVNGFLVGHASANLEDFVALLRASK